jgi:hypothetical protein
VAAYSRALSAFAQKWSGAIRRRSKVLCIGYGHLPEAILCGADM